MLEAYLIIGATWGIFLYSFIVYTLNKHDRLDNNISIWYMAANVIGFYLFNSITWPLTLGLFLYDLEDFEKTIVEGN
jgi:hypothetical protein